MTDPRCVAIAIVTMNASDRLRAWRDAKELSQAAAAAKVPVSQTTWSDWEAGKKCPHIAQALRIQELTGIEVMAWKEVAEAHRSASLERMRKTGTDA